MPLTFQYMPYEEFSGLDSDKKIQKLLKVVRQNRVILMEGTLNTKEESNLIQETMSIIDSKFKGIEISSFNPLEKGSSKSTEDRIRRLFSAFIYGRKRGLTIIGPANIVKEMRKDPRSIQLFLSNRRG